jgi:hypothetical protein
MPVRFLTAVSLVLFTLGSATQASAECWVSSFFKSIVRDIKDRQVWPDQYRPLDKAAQKAPFPVMIENGWRRQNLLVDAHFDQNTKQLTEAGQIKVRWILTAAPQQHRSIYVHAAGTTEDTSARIASVQQYVSKVSPNDLPPILTTTISEEGWSAQQIDQIGKKYLEGMPAPKLPSASGSSAGGSGK